MVKDGTFFTVQSFMVNQLGLRGNDLTVYAIIYGFSQDGESVFHGSRQYLADWCNSTVRGIQKNLNNLMERHLIEQVYHSTDNHQVHYRAIIPNTQGTDEQSSQGEVNKVHEGSEQSSLYNIADSIVDNIDKVSTNVDTSPTYGVSVSDLPTEDVSQVVDTTPPSTNNTIRKPQKILTEEKTKEKKPNLYERCQNEIVNRYGLGKLNASLHEYLGYRIRSRQHPMGFSGWVGLLNKLDLLGQTEDEKCKIVEQSIKMKWDTFVELKTWGRKTGCERFGEHQDMRSGAPVGDIMTNMVF